MQAMAEYFQEFFIEGTRAPSYIPSIMIQVLAMILLLGKNPKSVRDYALLALDWVGNCALIFLITSVYYGCVGTYNMDFFAIIALTLLYALTRSQKPALRRLVMASMFLACALSSYPLSAPWGEFFQGVDPTYWSWASYLTLVVMLLMTTAEVWFLRHFALPENSSIPIQYALIQVVVSLTTIGIEWIYGIEGVYGVEEKLITNFNIVVATALWAIDLLLYYMLFNISKSNDEKIMLLSTQHKIRMEQEKYEANRVNYDELRAMRHELKNYTFYVKALLDAKRYDELSEFLEHAQISKNKALNSYDCGNYIVDVIMNHEINAAREQGVVVKPDILVPHQLPIADEDLCSLLSNLMDNAIEAAAVSGKPEPHVNITIRPKQEYLFIHQENSVSDDIPASRRLSLETTKKDNRELHGIGTRIIRKIVDAYGGSVKYAMADGLMTTNVMVELRREEDK